MIADTIDALRVLAGDALIAAGELIRGGSDDIDIWPADFEPAAMECDGPDSTKPIPLDEIRSALNDLPDSVLIRAAAAVIRQSSYSGDAEPAVRSAARPGRTLRNRRARRRPSAIPIPACLGDPPDRLVAPRRVKEWPAPAPTRNAGHRHPKESVRMSEPTLRPIRTTDDTVQAEVGAAIQPYDPDPNPDMLPFRRPAGLVSTCACCGAWPDEQCEPGCLNLMTDEQQRAHRDGVLDSVIAELGIEESAPFVVYATVAPRPTGAHRRPTRRASHFARMVLVVLTLVLVLVVGVLWAASRANALPSNCQQQFWLMLGANTRTICDGPVRPDGSWNRAREFWTPEHYVRGSGYCYRYGGCSYTAGYWQPTTTKGVETYVVTPETVLADEPGHLG